MEYIQEYHILDSMISSNIVVYCRCGGCFSFNGLSNTKLVSS